jgi:hypothetical protein
MYSSYEDEDSDPSASTSESSSTTRPGQCQNMGDGQSWKGSLANKPWKEKEFVGQSKKFHIDFRAPPVPATVTAGLRLRADMEGT